MARKETLLIRLTPNEKLAFKRCAELSGLSLSSWVRERLRQSAMRQLEAAAENIPFIEEAENGVKSRNV